MNSFQTPLGGVMWQKGRVKIIRHCDSVFELTCNDEQVMPIGSFEQICRGAQRLSSKQIPHRKFQDQLLRDCELGYTT